MALPVSAGVVIYAYTMGYLGGFGGTEQLGAMSVDEASIDSTSGLTAYIRNIGKTTIEFDTVYVEGTNVTFTASPTSITEGSIGTITVADSDYDFNAGTTYEIKIIASDNTQLSFSEKAS
jgi:archaellum component FlaG (FlaF/FlaG flagellin family)